LIIKNTADTYDVGKSLEGILKNVEKEVKNMEQKLGDPKLIDTRAYNTGEAKITDNLSMAKIREAAKDKNVLKAYDSEKIYEGEDLEMKYNIAEAAYINYENILIANEATKRSLVAKRGALALSLKSARSVAEVAKISSALQVVNGKLDTIREQEQTAHNKLVAIQIRNDQKEKLVKEAQSKKLMMDFFNGNVMANSQPFPDSKGTVK
jgi:hypothetical protein